MSELPFEESTLLDGIPEILAQEPWMQVRSMVFAAEKARLFDDLRQRQRYTGIPELPEKLLDLLALDSLLWHYRETDDTPKKKETLANAWQFWSLAGTRCATKKITEIFFEGHGAVEEWHEYGGVHNHFRLKIMDHVPTWNELRQYLEVSDYFRRLSQKLEEIKLSLQVGECNICVAGYPEQQVTIEISGAYRAADGAILIRAFPEMQINLEIGAM